MHDFQGLLNSTHFGVNSIKSHESCVRLHHYQKGYTSCISGNQPLECTRRICCRIHAKDSLVSSSGNSRVIYLSKQFVLFGSGIGIEPLCKPTFLRRFNTNHIAGFLSKKKESNIVFATRFRAHCFCHYTTMLFVHNQHSSLFAVVSWRDHYHPPLNS